MEQIKTIAMMGKPGSGKGTQAKLLSEALGFDLFSSGDAFRELHKQDTFIGRKAKEEMNKGYLMPHWFASYWFEHKVFNIEQNHGVVFEGPGRKLPEAELFSEVMEWLERPYRAINLLVDEDLIIERLHKRAEEEGRGDDDPESIKLRFEEYNKYTTHSIEHFRKKGTLIEVDGMKDPEVVQESILNALKEIG